MTTNESYRSHVIKRLNKILALSKSDNPGEAAAALHQAGVIMEKYELHESEVVLLGIEEARSTLSSVELSDRKSVV